MTLNVEKSSASIKEAYDKILSDMIDRYEKSNDYQKNLNNPRINNVFNVLKKHQNKMDVFSTNVVKMINDSNITKLFNVESCVLTANGHGIFELLDNEKVISKIFLCGSQREAFETEPNDWNLTYALHEKSDNYPYIKFFDSDIEKSYEDTFESMKKDFQMASSLRRYFPFDYTLGIENKSIKKISNDNTTILLRTSYSSVPFMNRKENQAVFDFIYESNKEFLKYQSIDSFEKFKLVFKDLKLKKRFFKSMGFSISGIYIADEDVFFCLKNKNNEQITVVIPMSLEFKDIGNAKIKKDKETDYTIRDYLKSPEEVMGYLRLLDY